MTHIDLLYWKIGNIYPGAKLLIGNTILPQLLLSKLDAYEMVELLYAARHLSLEERDMGRQKIGRSQLHHELCHATIFEAFATELKHGSPSFVSEHRHIFTEFLNRHVIMIDMLPPPRSRSP